jgi:hypothetical protein
MRESLSLAKCYLPRKAVSRVFYGIKTSAGYRLALLKRTFMGFLPGVGEF